MRSPRGGTCRFVTRLRERRKLREYKVQEPRYPDALAAALGADTIHAIVPVAGTDQQQLMRPDVHTALKGARTVFEQCCRLASSARQEKVVGFAAM